MAKAADRLGVCEGRCPRSCSGRRDPRGGEPKLSGAAPLCLGDMLALAMLSQRPLYKWGDNEQIPLQRDAGQWCLCVADPHMCQVQCCCIPLSARPVFASPGHLQTVDVPMQEAARKEAKHKRNANKWIFVTSADGQQLYVAPKVKGNFQHSSFLAGEPQTLWLCPL